MESISTNNDLYTVSVDKKSRHSKKSYYSKFMLLLQSINCMNMQQFHSTKSK